MVCGVVWCGVVWCGVVWCGVVWCGVVWCGVVWCGVVWCGVVWCGVVWCGVVWCGVVWCGVVWCGVVWCGSLIPFCRIRQRPCSLHCPPFLRDPSWRRHHVLWIWAAARHLGPCHAAGPKSAPTKSRVTSKGSAQSRHVERRRSQVWLVLRHVRTQTTESEVT